MPIYTHTFNTAIGELVCGTYDGKVVILDFAHRKQRTRVDQRVMNHLGCSIEPFASSAAMSAQSQVHEFLSGTRKIFELPLMPLGSDFQIRVWKALQKIPYGETRSYKQIAEAMGQPTAVRAIANANGANSIALAIPCHRVIGSDHSLTGYGGGLQAKQVLLSLEAQHSRQASLL